MPATVDQDDEAALNRLLTDDPRSLSGHVRLGDVRAAAGQDSLARHYYRTALQIAAEANAANPEVERARTMLAEIEQRTAAKRAAVMTERGFSPEHWSPRFARAIAEAASLPGTGASQPTDFEFPGLRAAAFHDPRQFAWAAQVEAAFPAIRDELVAELGRGADDFRAYVQDHSVSAAANEALLGNKDWSILALAERGWVSTATTARCPRAWAALMTAPLPAIYGWGPTAVFSRLAAGAHIPAHHGMFNTRLICHLPIIVPPGCRFRVGDEMREWEAGRLMIFDDTIEHEAWNDGEEDRMVLIFDIWRPELSEREKEELTALFHV